MPLTTSKRKRKSETDKITSLVQKKIKRRETLNNYRYLLA